MFILLAPIFHTLAYVAGGIVDVHTVAYVAPMTAKPSLTRTDWIQCAFRALTLGGPQAIKAEALARALHVSKGSFYWHFKDVAALKAAMIDHWKQGATVAIIQALDSGDQPPRARLNGLILITSSDRNVAYGGAQAEPAIRDWARYDGAVKDAVRGVDQQRLDYVQALFGALGFEANSARARARVFYGALIGLQQLAYLDGIDIRRDMQRLLAGLLGEQAPSPAGHSPP